MSSLTYTFHGVWSPFTPTSIPEGFPPNAAFIQNDSGDEWYAYQRSLMANASNSVYMTAAPITADQANTITANAANTANPLFFTFAIQRDLEQMFPIGMLLVQIDGIDPDNKTPWKGLEQQVFDQSLLTYTPRYTPPPRVITAKKDIWIRATDAEAETIEQVLAKQPVRKQRIFNEATYLDHADTMYQELYQGFVDAFGQPRADELLAAS